MKEVRDRTKEWNEAESAVDSWFGKIDYKAQYCVPDFESALRAAYKHGYVEALQTHGIYPKKIVE